VLDVLEVVDRADQRVECARITEPRQAVRASRADPICVNAITLAFGEPTPGM
jgi:hypothetical protein